jgi:geranyl diphosphate synthase
MANSVRAVAILGDQPQQVCDAAWQYGRHLGLAFQIVDDLLDILGSSKQLGKPALNDLRAGIATAPVLLAVNEQPALIELIRRKFKSSGDVQYALELVQASSGIQQAKALAAQHAKLAADQVLALPATECPHALQARQALISITHRVLARSH